MNAGLWRAEGEFTVARRIPWTRDEGLRPHIDRVVDAIRDGGTAVEVEVDADLDLTRVVLSVIVLVGEDGDGDLIARTCISDAIRECGGRHEELLPLADESRLDTRGGPWSGLRTPLWTLFRMSGDEVVQD